MFKLAKYINKDIFRDLQGLCEKANDPEVMDVEEVKAIETAFNEITDKIVMYYLFDIKNDANTIISDIMQEIDEADKEHYEYRLQENKKLNDVICKSLEKENTENNDYKVNLKSFTIYMETVLSRNFRALNLWNTRKLNIPPIPPKGYTIANQDEKIDLQPIFDEISEAIKKRYIELYPENEIDKDLKIPRLNIRMLTSLQYPIDKVNNELWGAKEFKHNIDEQLDFTFRTGKDKNPDIYVSCTIKWDNKDITISKELNVFEKRAYVAMGMLYYSGKDIFTLNEVYKAMGGDSTPNKNIRDKIDEALTKMGFARIYIDNETEIEANYNYPSVDVYDCPLLSFERLTRYRNGKKTTFIHLLQEPPLFKFAIDRNQIDTISREMLQAFPSLTEKNIQIEDFLITHISRVKRHPEQNKISFDKICEKLDIKDKRDKSRLRNKIKTALDFYKTISPPYNINNYKFDKNNNLILYF